MSRRARKSDDHSTAKLAPLHTWTVSPATSLVTVAKPSPPRGPTSSLVRVPFHLHLLLLKQSIVPDFFSPLCTVHANTSQVHKTQLYGSNGAYYKLQFDIILLAGLTELKAQIAWMEDVRAFDDLRPVLLLTITEGNREAVRAPFPVDLSRILTSAFSGVKPR